MTTAIWRILISLAPFSHSCACGVASTCSAQHKLVADSVRGWAQPVHEMVDALTDNIETQLADCTRQYFGSGPHRHFRVVRASCEWNMRLVSDLLFRAARVVWLKFDMRGAQRSTKSTTCWRARTNLLLSPQIHTHTTAGSSLRHYRRARLSAYGHSTSLSKLSAPEDEDVEAVLDGPAARSDSLQLSSRKISKSFSWLAWSDKRVRQEVERDYGAGVDGQRAGVLPRYVSGYLSSVSDGSFVPFAVAAQCCLFTSVQLALSTLVRPLANNLAATVAASLGVDLSCSPSDMFPPGQHILERRSALENARLRLERGLAVLDRSLFDVSSH